MSFLRLEIDYEKLKKFGIRKRAFQGHMRDALAAMGRAWHDRYLGKHFLESAYARYGYAMRKGMGMDRMSRGFRESYAGRKLRKYGHQMPLVFTGETLRLARRVNIKATSIQARVILPSGLNRKHSKSRISMRDEVTRLLPDEVRELLEVGRRAFRESIARRPAGA